MHALNCIGVREPFQLLEVGGAQIAVSRTGSGQSVVCLHAIGHGGRDFAAFVDLVSQRFEVVCLDWPSQGCSGEDDHALGIARYAQILKSVVSQLKLVEPIIVGCSIGGAAALLYARDNPVRALVLCNTGGLVPHSFLVRWYCLALARFFAAGARQVFWYPLAFRLYYRLILPSSSAAAQRRRITAAWRQSARILQTAWSEFATPGNDLSKTAVQLDTPMMIAWAMQDRILPFSMNRNTIRYLKNAVVKKFAGGHAAFLEQPVTFARDFENFVDNLPVTQVEPDKASLV